MPADERNLSERNGTWAQDSNYFCKLLPELEVKITLLLSESKTARSERWPL